MTELMDGETLNEPTPPVVVDSSATVPVGEAPVGEAPVGEAPVSEAPVSEAPGSEVDPSADLTAAVSRLADEMARLHERARHRELVIDNLHAEAEKLRMGERRSAIRPLLIQIARLRDDLVRQTQMLPDEVDSDWTDRLLQSFADTIEVTLEDYGIVIDTPKQGDAFDPRLHRVVASAITDAPDLIRTISGIRRDGYRDIEFGIPLAQAEVSVFVAGPESTPGPPPEPASTPIGAERESEHHVTGTADGAHEVSRPSIDPSNALAPDTASPVVDPDAH